MDGADNQTSVITILDSPEKETPVRNNDDAETTESIIELSDDSPNSTIVKLEKDEAGEDVEAADSEQDDPTGIRLNLILYIYIR